MFKGAIIFGLGAAGGLAVGTVIGIMLVTDAQKLQRMNGTMRGDRATTPSPSHDDPIKFNPVTQ